MTDFLSGLLDEIALEGLDGITLQMLWQRMRDRPNFSIPVDEDSKNFFWKVVATHRDIEVYELPKPRPFYPIYNRYEHIDPEFGIVIEPENLYQDPYAPIVPIKDGKVRGSCSTYEERKCITSKIRDDKLLVPLKEAEDTWGDCLVLVASPKLRLLSLIGTVTNPLIDMTLEAYCLLERVGRSRYLGEVTQGEGGLLGLKASFCRQLHYHRKKLTQQGLVTKQSHYMKSSKGKTSTGSLLHLTRFYVQRRSKMATYMKDLCDILKDKPQNQEACNVLRAELDIPGRTFRKLFNKSSGKYVKLVSVPCHEFFPDATEKELFTPRGEPREVKVCQLLRHCDEEVEEEDEEEDASDKKERCLPLNIHFDFSKINVGVPLVHQMYDHIKNAGPKGISSGDLGRIMTLPRLVIRSLLNLLLNKDHIISVLEDRGRQKVNKYTAKIYTDVSSLKDHDTSTKKTVQVNKESSSCKREGDDNDCAYDEALPTKRARMAESVLPSYADTEKKRERSAIILEFLKSERLTTLGKLNKHILEEEKQKGYRHRLDKRSTDRLVKSLCDHKKIKVIKDLIKSEDKQIEIEFICDNSVDESDPLLQAAIEDAKFKNVCVPKKPCNNTRQAIKKDGSSPGIDCNSDASVNKSAKGRTKSVKKQPTECSEKYPRMTPKFLRAKALHSFLFHLVYNHKGNSGENKEHVIYHDVMNWRRFVPPLPKRVGEGWLYLSDIYTRMPLSLFVKIVRFSHGFPGLNQYLENEERSHHLITFLPQDLRDSLLNKRKFLFSTNEVIKTLCYLGLVSLGPSTGNQRDQFFLYLHKHASIKDTTISPSGYVHIKKDIDYDVKSYTFETEDDVETFWLDLENITFRTSLGKFSAAAGKTIRITEADYKPELISSTRNKQFNEVVDDGSIPGDGLGAGGFDSSLYLHCRRNWQNSTRTSPPRNSHNLNPKRNRDLVSLQNLLKKSNKSSAETRTRLQRLTPNASLMQKESKPAEKKSPLSKKVAACQKVIVSKKNVAITSKFPAKKERTKIRTVKMRETKKRAPYHDEKDKAAMMKMDKARCTWTSQEDSFLLLCKVASSFLDPNWIKNSVVPSAVVRDLLHEKVPGISENKTSQACLRRLRYMMLNPETVNNVNVFLGEALQDDELVKEFNVSKPPKTNEEVWVPMFTTVVQKLLEKFTSSASERCKNFILPASREELDEHYELKSYKTNHNVKDLYKSPNSVEDIRKFVISSLILSAMAVTDGAEWSRLLNYLYQCFPDNYLSFSVNSLRKAGVLSLNKRTCRSDLKRSLQSSGPYKFSINYSNAMLTKFPVKIFKEAEKLFNKLKSLEPGTDEELVGDVPPGFVAAVLSLVQTEQLYMEIRLPSQIIVFDSYLSQEARSNIFERIASTLSDKESTELSRLLNEDRNPTTVVKNKKSRFKTKSALVRETTLDGLSITDDTSLMENPQMPEVQPFVGASRFALYLMRQEMSQPPIDKVQHAQDYIVLNSCRVLCHLEPKRDIPDLPIIPVDIIDNSSNQGTLQANDEAVCITKEKLFLTNDKIAEISQQLVEFIPSNVFLQNVDYTNQIETLCKNYSSSVLLDAKLMFDTIYSAGEIGITEKDIWIKFRVLSGNFTVFEHLDIFRKSRLAIRAGIVEFIYVCGCFARNYVLRTFPSAFFSTRRKNNASSRKVHDSVSQRSSSRSQTKIRSHVVRVHSTESDRSMRTVRIDDKEEQQLSSRVSTNILRSSTKTETLYFIPRTWRNPDGSLNKPTFFSLLSTVLSHIISVPGVSSSQVCEQFSLTLPPVQTLELIEILEKASCVYKYYCNPLKKKSLFSSPRTIAVTKNREPEDVDHIEPYPDAVCKIADLHSAI